jgi:hypothetical protein
MNGHVLKGLDILLAFTRYLEFFHKRIPFKLSNSMVLKDNFTNLFLYTQKSAGSKRIKLSEIKINRDA